MPRRDNGYEKRRDVNVTVMPPEVGQVRDGGPWRGPSLADWIARLRRGAGLPVERES